MSCELPVDQVDYFSFVLVKTWRSAREAASGLGGVSEEDILSVCRGKLDEAGGLRFSFSDVKSPASVPDQGSPPPATKRARVDDSERRETPPTLTVKPPSEMPTAAHLDPPSLAPTPSRVEGGTGAGAGAGAVLAPEAAAVKQVDESSPAAREPDFPPPTVCLGGVHVNAIAVGTLAWSVAYPDASKRPSDELIRIMIREALGWRGALASAAPTLFDCADSYCPSPPQDFGWMERVLAAELQRVGALGPAPGPGLGLGLGLAEPPQLPQALIATKGGMDRLGPASNQWRPVDTNSQPLRVEQFQDMARASCHRLGAAPFLWQIHHCRDDSFGPILRAVAGALRPEGAVRLVGLCNVPSLKVLQRCIDQLPAGLKVASVQNRFSLFIGPAERTRQEELLDWCESEASGGVVFLAYGLFGGIDARNSKVSVSQQSFPSLCALAAQRGVTPHALHIAYLRHRWPRCCMPLVGARNPQHLRELGAAYGVRLSAKEVRTLATGGKMVGK